MREYPKHWWAPIHDPLKPIWEILPQEAGPGEVILSKRNELGMLSNFALIPFEFEGVKYKSIEGFWQMMFYPESKSSPYYDSADLRLLGCKVKLYLKREEVVSLEGHDAYSSGVRGFDCMKALGLNYVTFKGKKYEYWVQNQNEHYQLIVRAMTAKLEQNENVKKALMSTGDLKLRADHYEPASAPPSWGYYNIWMDLRNKCLV